MQRIGAKGFSKTTIEALYDGALSLDCVAGVISVHLVGGKLKDIDEAEIVTLHAIREIRISVRKGLTREVDTYSSILESFSSAVPKDVDTGFRLASQGDDAQELNAYLKVLNGCVSKKGLTGAAKDAG